MLGGRVRALEHIILLLCKRQSCHYHMIFRGIPQQDLGSRSRKPGYVYYHAYFSPFLIVREKNLYDPRATEPVDMEDEQDEHIEDALTHSPNSTESSISYASVPSHQPI